MAVDVTTRTRIERPVTEVAAYAADPGTAPHWYANIESVTWLTDPPLRTGSRFLFVAHFLGRRLEYRYEVTGHDPARTLTMATPGPPFPMRTTYTWEDLDGTATLMSLRNEGGPGGLLGLASPIAAAAIRAATTKDLARLKRVLEEVPR